MRSDISLPIAGCLTIAPVFFRRDTCDFFEYFDEVVGVWITDQSGDLFDFFIAVFKVINRLFYSFLVDILVYSFLILLLKYDTDVGSCNIKIIRKALQAQIGAAIAGINIIFDFVRKRIVHTVRRNRTDFTKKGLYFNAHISFQVT